MARSQPSHPIPFIELDAVSKRFNDKQLVLDDISLSLQREDFVALIGPSGCGKSTLLKLIANLIACTAGTIQVAGGDVKDASEKLGFVFQDANLLPWINIIDNVAMPMKICGFSQTERLARASDMLDMVGLSQAKTLYPRELSGGMRMRTSIARALASDPEILLLDEPFGALDEMTRDDLNEDLLQLREKQKWTGIFVTHSVTEAVFLSNRVLVMSANPGKIHETIEIDLPYPRTAETRTTEAFQSQLAEVTRSLHSVRAAPVEDAQ